ncbi:hypothetical protein BV921_20085 [Pectobacterium odoriferum]|uniref:Secreted protein n=1 Tax=Pectobacterium odoriferum TaxID=78398 RepID=A0ABD6VP98_9GAMM|nr:hypothetical protein BV925_16410 [Pectobacterium odoriferum]POD94452.1 hypothetical protein BVY06_14605 [Pectobacterium odoriferum]POE07364.1 hypothetical protein BV921_20085 [Pectobacterium odoriferum]POE12098.1 hypothetical protein BV924_13155 [Pectobacterium odoriferum]POE25983.1 hypothetical protein BV926_13160 [Pectobacterium odoriferum]
MLFSPICIIPVILQAACVLATFKYSARRGPRPKGPLLAVFKSAPGRFVNRINYLSKFIGIPSLAACLQLELFRIDTRSFPLFFNTVFSYQYG